MELQEILILSLEDVENITNSSTLSVGDFLPPTHEKFLYLNSTILKDIDENHL